jgi:hypothetical protein
MSYMSGKLIGDNKIRYSLCSICGKPTFFSIGLSDRDGRYYTIPIHDGDCLTMLQRAYPDKIEINNNLTVYEWIRTQYIKEANKP